MPCWGDEWQTETNPVQRTIEHIQRTIEYIQMPGYTNNSK